MTTATLRLPNLSQVSVVTLLLSIGVLVLLHSITQVGAQGNNPPGLSRGQGPLQIGLGYLDPSAMTQEDRRVLVCDNVPRDNADCRNTPSWRDYFRQNWQRMTGTGGSRKRRFANFNNWDFDPWSWTPWSGWSSWPSGGGNQGSNTAYVCPQQLNQSALFQLSPVATGYPAEAIAQEFGLDITMFTVLLKEAVLSDTPPSVLQEDFVNASPATCPYTERQLWQYTSSSQGLIMCWVLANFGDFVRYRDCDNRICRNCELYNGTSSGSSWSGWHNDPFWGWQQPRNTLPGTVTRNLCLTDYRAVSLWAYCPTKASGTRIVRDRIILPVSCSCRTVTCPRF